MAAPPSVRRVSRASFPDAVAALRTELRGASFVSIDTELSGLSAQLERPSLMDPVARRYAQLRESAESFAIVQFGISCFTWRPDTRAFDVRTFQFPIFPAFHGPVGMPDRSFMAQAKCLTYIRQHGFDLNAWVDDGIGYLSHVEQQALEHVLKRPLREDVQAKFRNDAATAIRTHENDRFLKDMRKRVEKLMKLAGESGSENGDALMTGAETNDQKNAITAFLKKPISAPSPRLLRDAGTKSWPVFVTEPLAPFRRSALMTLIENGFPKVLALDCPSDNDHDEEVKASPWKRRLRILVADAESEREAMKAMHAEIIDEEHERYNLSLVGFTAVFDLLVDASKHAPIVGHNMLLDVMQCFDKFHGPLPDSCATFLFEFHKLLENGLIFDTKVLVEYAMEHIDIFGERLEHSALEHVYENVSKDPFHGPAVHDVNPYSSSRHSHSPKKTQLGAHQAGYDAYMTGCVFLRVCCGLGVPNDAIANLKDAVAGGDHAEAAPQWQRCLLALKNSMNLHRILPPVTLTLPGPHPEDLPTPSRACFVRMQPVRAFVPKLKTFHIQQCVAWALGIRSNKDIKVHYETKARVFLQLPTAEHAVQLMKIRRETEETRGTDRNPLPSIGCVDLFACNGEQEASELDAGMRLLLQEEGIPVPKRQKRNE